MTIRKTAAFSLAALALAAAPALASGDAAKGEKVFKKCQACHQVGPDAQAKTGPILNGVVGRTAGTSEFAYSDAMVTKGQEGLVWSEATLAEFLAKPKDFVSGTKMAFAGLRKDDEIADVIAFLASHN